MKAFLFFENFDISPVSGGGGRGMKWSKDNLE